VGNGDPRRIITICFNQTAEILVDSGGNVTSNPGTTNVNFWNGLKAPDTGAIDLWNNAGGYFLSYVTDCSQADVDIGYSAHTNVQGNCADTTPNATQQNPTQLTHATIHLSEWLALARPSDIAATIAHEIGHVYGLADNSGFMTSTTCSFGQTVMSGHFSDVTTPTGTDNCYKLQVPYPSSPVKTNDVQAAAAVVTPPNSCSVTAALQIRGDEDGGTLPQPLWVVVHDDPDGLGNIVMTSPDGITWTPRNTPITDSGYAVTFGAGGPLGNGLYVLGANGAASVEQIATSPDGITWTARSTDADNNSVVKIIFAAGRFVCLYNTSGYGNRAVMTSLDGAAWTSYSIPSPSSGWSRLAYSSALGLYVAVSEGIPSVMTSPDGAVWTEHTVTDPGDWAGVAFGNGPYVAMGGPAGSGVHLMTSPDGLTWTSQPDPAGSTQRWDDMIFAGGQFVAVAATLGGDHLVTSPDGAIWTIRSAPADKQWLAVWYDGLGLYVAVSSQESDSNAVMTSPDGITWTSQTTPSVNYGKDITYGVVLDN